MASNNPKKNNKKKSSNRSNPKRNNRSEPSNNESESSLVIEALNAVRKLQQKSKRPKYKIEQETETNPSIYNKNESGKSTASDNKTIDTNFVQFDDRIENKANKLIQPVYTEISSVKNDIDSKISEIKTEVSEHKVFLLKELGSYSWKTVGWLLLFILGVIGFLVYRTANIENNIERHLKNWIKSEFNSNSSSIKKKPLDKKVLKTKST